MAVFPLAFPVLRPAMEVITAITTVQVQNQVIYTITTGQNHYYLAGLYVRITVPLGFGMQALSGTIFEILTVPTLNTFTVSQTFDQSTMNDPFVVVNTIQQAQVIPVAEDVYQLYQSVHNVLPRGI